MRTLCHYKQRKVILLLGVAYLFMGYLCVSVYAQEDRNVMFCKLVEPNICTKIFSLQQYKTVPTTMENSLFIGDSRTVGLSMYGDLDGADFFAKVGLTAKGVMHIKRKIPGVGYVSLSRLLEEKRYNKIYLMFGVNEIGGNLSKIWDDYMDVVHLIQKKQPDAVLILQANLYVTEAYTRKHKSISNRKLKQFHKMIEQLADDKHIFYMDANTVFEDGAGNLSKQHTKDGVHLTGNGYEKWGKWIKQQTEDMFLYRIFK